MEPYHELGPEYFVKRHSPERHARKLVGQLAALGYDVSLTPREAA